MSDDTPDNITTNPDEMDALYRVFRKGFSESAEGWNGETYHGNYEAYERRLQARFEALRDAGEFDAVPKEDLRALIEEWRETADEISDPQESINALQACANQVENLL